MFDIASSYKKIKSDMFDSKFEGDALISTLILDNEFVVILVAISKANGLKHLFISPKCEIANSDLESFPKVNGFNASLATFDFKSVGTRKYIAINEIFSKYETMFIAAVQDICVKIGNLNNSSQVIDCIKENMKMWKHFFGNQPIEPMSESSQQGLYGELYFLRSLCNSDIFMKALVGWTGPDKETHDFYLGKNAVEIKTTSTNAPFKMRISNENQLSDIDIQGDLFIAFYALRTSTNSGETLKGIVDTVRTLISQDINLLARFEKKLSEYGYSELHTGYYINGYTIREQFYFKVIDGFPRIERNNLPTGVGDINYSVLIDTCKKYQVNFAELLASLMN